MAELEFKIFSELQKAIKSTDLEFNVRSDSMKPLLKVGDVIKVTELESDPNRFDIIVFKGQNKALFVHYVWRILINHKDNKPYYLTRGINNKERDFPVNREDILGVVNNYKITEIGKYCLVLKLWLRRKLFNEV